MNLPQEMQGMFVCDALNRLADPEWLRDNPDDGCCPRCCAPCAALKELYVDGTLNDVVRMAPPELWQDVSWWKNGQVNTRYLAVNWAGCLSNTRCDETDGSML